MPVELAFPIPSTYSCLLSLGDDLCSCTKYLPKWGIHQLVVATPIMASLVGWLVTLNLGTRFAVAVKQGCFYLRWGWMRPCVLLAGVCI